MSEERVKPIENENLSSALGEILSNPQMLSTITSIAQSLKSASAPTESTAEEKINETESKDTASEAASVAPQSALPSGLTELLGAISSKSTAKSRQSELLCALKPYLSQNRADAIDKIIRFSELSNLFKGLT